MSINRRQFLQTTAAVGVAASAGVLGAPAIAQSRAKVKVGYLHTLAVDGQIWTGIDRGNFAKHNVELDLVQFTTGPRRFKPITAAATGSPPTAAASPTSPPPGRARWSL